MAMCKISISQINGLENRLKDFTESREYKIILLRLQNLEEENKELKIEIEKIRSNSNGKDQN